MIEKPRLLPAVILGAMGLLALKMLGWYLDVASIDRPAAAIAAASRPERGTGGLPQSKIPDGLMDPMVTGTIDKPPAPKGQPLPQDHPLNKAAIINGTAAAPSPAEKALLERLGQRREEIEARMRELEMRERLLDSAEKKLDGKLGDLKQLEDKNASPAGSVAAEEAKAVKNLVIMYEAMKPKDAARVFDRLSLDVLVPVVQQMNPRKMSEVLAAMAPEKAEKLTIALANQGRTPQIERAADRTVLPPNELPAIAPPARR